MSEFIKNFVNKNKPQFLKYKAYIEANNWADTSVDGGLDDNYFNNEDKVRKAETPKKIKDMLSRQKSDMKTKSDEYKLQNDLISNILNVLKYFINKTDGSHHLKCFKKFVDFSLKIVDIHLERVDYYLVSVDLTKIENQEVRSEEIKLTKDCFEGITKIQDIISKFNIKEEQVADGIEFLDNIKAPLSMHKILVELYPQIKIKIDSLGIDFTTPPKNEMLINMKNIPQWNPDKHYWEQEREVLQFYVDEFKKLENGINIDGIYISGWAYYHINVFVTPIPHKIWNPLKGDYDSKDIIMNPPLRDSDWIIFENKNIQEREKILFMFIAATRRAAKTTAESSMLGHAATIGKMELLCAGSNAKDLGQIAKNFKIDTLHKNPAFAIYNVTNDWSKKIEIGLKKKNQKTIALSVLHIINTDDGNNKEIFAGFTPDLVVIDEAMKSKFLEALEGLIPAMRGADGMIRAFGTLSGTGGTDKLSEDGYKVLQDPSTYDVLPMQWDLLERGVPKEFITWEEDKRKEFGTFIPGQCRVDMPKIDSTLANYLGIKSKELEKIKIKVTDWEKSLDAIQKRRRKVEVDRVKHQKEVVYCPIKPSEIFMSGALNPFPVQELRKRREELESTGDVGKKVILTQNDKGIISQSIVNTNLADFPHKGGFVDAPVVLYEDMPKDKPPDFLYVCGFDDYKQEESDTDSIGSFHVYKVNIGMDKWCGRIVASIASRPDPHNKLHRQIYLLQQAFNAKCFMENADDLYKQYLEGKRVADEWLFESLDFKADLSQKATNRRKFGWTPTPQNKKFLFNLAVKYTKEEFEIETESGTITMLGVQKINDVGLIEEMINYREGGNFDRITSFMSCLGIEFYLDVNYMLPSSNWKQIKEKKEEVKEYKPKNLAQRMYGGSTRKRGLF